MYLKKILEVVFMNVDNLWPNERAHTSQNYGDFFEKKFRN